MVMLVAVVKMAALMVINSIFDRKFQHGCTSSYKHGYVRGELLLHKRQHRIKVKFFIDSDQLLSLMVVVMIDGGRSYNISGLSISFGFKCQKRHTDMHG
jgi:hypothetical protein